MLIMEKCHESSVTQASEIWNIYHNMQLQTWAFQGKIKEETNKRQGTDVMC